MRRLLELHRKQRTFLITLALAIVSSMALAQENPPISIDVKDADIHNVFRLLATTGRVNIVVSDGVKGKVTMRLSRVPWEEAFQVLLTSKGLGFQRMGSVIQVDTVANLKHRNEMLLAARKAQEVLTPLSTEVIPINYARAEELAPIVERMLTDRGSISVDMRSNSLIITDVPGSAAFEVK